MDLIMKMWRKSLKHEIEVKVRWQVSDWHVPTKKYLYTKYGGSRFYRDWEMDLIMKTERKSLKHEIEVKVRWQVSDWHVPTKKYLYTKYGGSRYYRDWEMDLITKTERKIYKCLQSQWTMKMRSRSYGMYTAGKFIS